MVKKIIYLSLFVFALTSCSENIIGVDDYVDVTAIPVDVISEEMAKVRDYIPQNAVIAHRGSTYWVPEETEAAFRWAREMGADYLEADLQISLDGVLLALHDEDLSRTTNIESVYGETIPESRVNHYMSIGYTFEEAYEKYIVDKATMASIPLKYLPCMYTYEELLALDAGTWFNDANPDVARSSFSDQRQYVCSLQDLIMFSKGKRLKRDENGDRVYTKGGKTGTTVYSLLGFIQGDEIEYTFEYEDDPAHTGHIPGIYLEFKNPMYAATDIEQRVYDELASVEDMNIIEKPESSDNPFYVNGLVNTGNTNGKVILQTFDFDSLSRVKEVFEGKVPMCFLTGPMYNVATPIGYAEMVSLAVQQKAHIIGPYIEGTNESWCDYLIEKAGLVNHPWSFDSTDQMTTAYGKPALASTTTTLYNPPYFDAMFTNRTELTLDFMILYGLRGEGASSSVPNPNTILDNLGYTK